MRCRASGGSFVVSGTMGIPKKGVVTGLVRLPWVFPREAWRAARNADTREGVCHLALGRPGFLNR